MGDNSGEGEQAVHSQRARCVEHGLAVGGDGKCVLCRRSTEPTESPTSLRGGGASIPVSTSEGAEKSSGFPVFGVLALVTLGAGGSFGYWKTQSSDPAASQDPVVVAALPSEARDEIARIERRRSSRRSVVDAGEKSAPLAEPGRSSPFADAPQDLDARGPQPSLSNAEISGYIAELDVQLYATTWCGYCEKTRALFAANGVTYHEHDVERDPAAKIEKERLSPGTGIPVVSIDGEVIVGFKPQAFARAISRGVEKKSGVPVQVQFKTIDE